MTYLTSIAELQLIPALDVFYDLKPTESSRTLIGIRSGLKILRGIPSNLLAGN